VALTRPPLTASLWVGDKGGVSAPSIVPVLPYENGLMFLGTDFLNRPNVADLWHAARKDTSFTGLRSTRVLVEGEGLLIMNVPVYTLHVSGHPRS
jgi:hypothetical protein